MRSHRDTALILEVFDLGERDRGVVLLTAEAGKVRGAARGARTKYSRFAGQLQPLAKVEVGWFEKTGRDLVRIDEVKLARPAAALSGELEDLLLGAYLADHMNAFAQENEAAPILFRLLDSTIEALLNGVERSLAARYYEVWMLFLAGIFPIPRACPLCDEPYRGRALLIENDSALVCAACAADAIPGAGETFLIGPRVLDFLLRCREESLAELSAAPPGGRVLERVEQLCARVRRAFLQDELKSYSVMKRTLALAGAPAGGPARR